MKYRISFFIYSNILISFSISQAQVDTLWTKTFGGIGFQEGNSVHQTTDGGYIIAGITDPFGSGTNDPDVWLIKTDSLGDTLWTKIFGGNSDDLAKSVIQTNEGGYLIAGSTFSFGSGNSDVWLIKTDAFGDTLWTKTFGGSDDDRGWSVHQTTDSGYIITGSTSSFGSGNSDVLLIKMNNNGDSLWTKTFGGSDYDGGRSASQTIDGGNIIAGMTSSFGAGISDVWLIKTDAFGDMLWTKTFGGSSNDLGWSVQQTVDSGYIITGSTSSFGSGNMDVWLIKTDSFGDTLWTKTFGGNDYDPGWSVQQTTDGGYIIAGSTASFGAGYGDVWLIKTDASGSTLWTNSFGGSADDRGWSVQQTTDDGFIIAGYKDLFGAGADVWLIKTTPDITVVEQGDMIISDYSLQQNFPNPFNPSTTIIFTIADFGFVNLKIYDVLGNEIATLVDEYKPAGNYEVGWDASNYPSGIYFYQLKTKKFIETKKMILMK